MGLIHVICDYALGDLAFAEVVSALRHYVDNEYELQLTSVGSFETVATGFAVAQLSLQDQNLRPHDMIVFANCAPRKDRTEARKNNEGEGILYAILNNGVPIIVVNSGNSLSFVRDEIKELWSVSVPSGGSQFRSRDTFPYIVGQIARGDLSFKKDKLIPRDVIPEVPNNIIGYVDSFGNIKTTFRNSELSIANLSPGQRVTITINGIEMSASVAMGSFEVHEGDIAFAPGSSGQETRYWEIFQRGGSAWHTFRKPRVGSFIHLK